MNEISQREYWAEIKRISEEMMGQPEDERYEWLHEAIDSHRWVIYTYYNMQVIHLSENNSYTFENFGPEACFDKETGIKWASLAYGAIWGDVWEQA